MYTQLIKNILKQYHWGYLYAQLICQNLVYINSVELTKM